MSNLEKLRASTRLLEGKLRDLSGGQSIKVYEKPKKPVRRREERKSMERRSNEKVRFETRLRSSDEIGPAEECLMNLVAWRQPKPIKRRRKVIKREIDPTFVIYHQDEEELRPAANSGDGSEKPETVEKQQSIQNLELGTAIKEERNKNFPLRDPLIHIPLKRKSKEDTSSRPSISTKTSWKKMQTGRDYTEVNTADNKMNADEFRILNLGKQLRIQLRFDDDKEKTIELQWNVDGNLDMLIQEISKKLHSRNQEIIALRYCGICIHSQSAWHQAMRHAFRKNSGILALLVHLQRQTTTKSSKPQHLNNMGRISLTAEADEILKSDFDDNDDKRSMLFSAHMNQEEESSLGKKYHSFAAELTRRLTVSSTSPNYAKRNEDTLNRKNLPPAASSSLLFLPAFASESDDDDEEEQRGRGSSSDMNLTLPFL